MSSEVHSPAACLAASLSVLGAAGTASDNLFELDTELGQTTAIKAYTRYRGVYRRQNCHRSGQQPSGFCHYRAL